MINLPQFSFRSETRKGITIFFFNFAQLLFVKKVSSVAIKSRLICAIRERKKNENLLQTGKVYLVWKSWDKWKKRGRARGKLRICFKKLA